MALAVGYQDGDAVGGLDAEKQAGVVGHQAVTLTQVIAGCFTGG